MNRRELEEAVQKAVDNGQDWLYMLIEGTPDAARQHLLGPRFGPKGWVVGHKRPDNLVRFNTRYVQEYLDELPPSQLGYSEEVGCELAADDIVHSFSRFRV